MFEQLYFGRGGRGRLGGGPGQGGSCDGRWAGILKCWLLLLLELVEFVKRIKSLVLEDCSLRKLWVDVVVK